MNKNFRNDDSKVKKFLGIEPGTSMQTKNMSFTLSSDTRVTKRKGEDIFIFEGYASTSALDRTNDIVSPNAFKNTIERHKAQNNRPIRMKYQHNAMELIGGFPIQYVQQDARGLKVRGEVCLGVQRGREVMSLIKGGYLNNLSIGFNVVDFDMDGQKRIIKDLELWEISVVDEPMNIESEIMSFKGVVPYHDLPLAPDSHKWDKRNAELRVRKFTGSDEEPSATYRKAFFWFDSARAEDFTAYKLPYADIVNGRMMAVPRALYAVAAVLDGGRGGVDIPSADKEKIKNQVERYYKKMDRESPFTKSFKVTANEIKSALTSVRMTEQLLKSTGAFDKRGARFLAPLLHDSLKARGAEELEREFESGKDLESGDYMHDDMEQEERRRKRARKRDPEDHLDDDGIMGLAAGSSGGMGKRKKKLPADRSGLDDEIEDEEDRLAPKRRKASFDEFVDEDDEEFEDEIDEMEDRLAPKRRKATFDEFVDEDDEEFEHEVGEGEGHNKVPKRRKARPGFDIEEDEDDPSFESEVSEGEGHNKVPKRRKASKFDTVSERDLNEDWDDENVKDEDDVMDEYDERREEGPYGRGNKAEEDDEDDDGMDDALAKLRRARKLMKEMRDMFGHGDYVY